MDWASRIFWTTSIQRSSMTIREKSRMLYMRTYHNRLCRFLESDWLPHQLLLLKLGYFKVAYAISRTKADSKLKAVLFQDQEQLRSQSRCRRISWKGYLHPPSLDSQSIDVRRWDYEQIQTRKAWQTFLIAWDYYCGWYYDSRQIRIYCPKGSEIKGGRLNLPRWVHPSLPQLLCHVKWQACISGPSQSLLGISFALPGLD